MLSSLIFQSALHRRTVICRGKNKQVQYCGKKTKWQVLFYRDSFLLCSNYMGEQALKKPSLGPVDITQESGHEVGP